MDRARFVSFEDLFDDVQDQFHLPGVGSVQEASDGCNDLLCLHVGSPFFCFASIRMLKMDVRLFFPYFKRDSILFSGPSWLMMQRLEDVSAASLPKNETARMNRARCLASFLLLFCLFCCIV